MNKVEWISIKDRLPEEGIRVLIIDKICGVPIMHTAYLDAGWWRDSYWDRPIKLGPNREVTHWTELPELPMWNS